MFKKAHVDESESTSEIPDDGDFRSFPLFAHHHLPQDLILSRLPSKHHKLHWLDWNQPTQSQSQCMLSKAEIRPFWQNCLPFTIQREVEWGRKIGSPAGSAIRRHSPNIRVLGVTYRAFIAWKDRWDMILPWGWAMEIIQLHFYFDSSILLDQQWSTYYVIYWWYRFGFY